MNFKELIRTKKELEAQEQVLIRNFIDSDNLYDKLFYEVAYDEVQHKIKSINKRIELLRIQS